jgi:hypothetical protein
MRLATPIEQPRTAMSTYFCDGIKEVTLLNGVARLEFYRLQKTDPAGNNPDMQPVTELTIGLPVQGFLQALSVLERIRDQLAREGVFQTTVAGAAGQAQPPPVP